jgi:AhpD family alkylhydroperoxidase
MRFRRRKYDRPRELLQDLRRVVSSRVLLRSHLRQLIPSSFRERLMMVVTEVNGCRYCSYYHSRLALASGVSEAELRDLLGGTVPPDTPAEELAALLYARQWAEDNAKPDARAEERLREVYGDDKARAIQLVLAIIRVGNLMGNTADYLLFRLTFGSLGLRKDEERFRAA